MSGASLGSVGGSKVAKKNLRNPLMKSLHQHSNTLGAKTARFPDVVPFRFWGSIMGAACVASFGFLWLNRHLFQSTPDSMLPEFQEAAKKHGPVAERSDAPPVFLNPISNRIPGYVRGPDDVKDL